MLAGAGLLAGGWTSVPVGRRWAGGRSCARWRLLDATGAVWYTRVRPRALLIRHKSGVGDWIINKVEFILDTRNFYKKFQKILQIRTAYRGREIEQKLRIVAINRTTTEKVKFQKVNDNGVICPCNGLTPLIDPITHGTIC